jgi:CubicO group peptidase (beta-lactamase class C family)
MTPVLASARPEDVGLSTAGLAAVDAAVQGQIDRGELAGAVTLVARHGKLVHLNAMGLKDIATGEPMASDNLFRIYSMTKPVTAAAMMILYDRGLWTPDDPIAKHLPEFAGVQVFDGLDAQGRPRLAAANHAPTLRELMTHTAGFSYGFDPADPVDKLYQAANVWRSAGLAEMSAKLASLPLAYQPGSKWLYSLSMDVQGAIIERLTGQSLPDFMQEHLFGPLGMVDTAFHITAEQRPRLAAGYRQSRSGLKPEKPMLFDHVEKPALASGGGGLISSVMDYARFAQMLLNRGELGGRKIISSEAAKLMMTNHLSEEMMAAGHGVGAQAIRPGFGYGFNGVVFTDPKAAGIPVGRGTYHWDGAWGTWFWVDPQHDLIYVGLIQRGLNRSPNLQALTQTLMADAIVTETAPAE